MNYVRPSTPITNLKFKQNNNTQGYHAGKVGRVNDDGSFYVKLDDGDSEWSMPALQIIPAYPFAPNTTATDHGGSSPGKNSGNVSQGDTGWQRLYNTPTKSYSVQNATSNSQGYARAILQMWQ